MDVEQKLFILNIKICNVSHQNISFLFYHRKIHAGICICMIQKCPHTLLQHHISLFSRIHLFLR